MSRIGGACVVLALLLAACGQDTEPVPEIPSWAHVAPEQIAEAKKHGVPVAFENELGMRFVLIPAGTFLMGSPEDEETHREYRRYPDDERQHQVTISQPFYMSIYETTHGQFREFHADYVSTAHSMHFLSGEDHPVPASWWHATSFAGWLSVRDWGRTYRLPSEAEWEYACRAGTTTPFAVGETISTDQANYNGRELYGQGVKGKFRGVTTRVGAFPANGWGLHDMHGNLWEWCQDWYGPYPTEPVTDPSGSPSGKWRALRGGDVLAYPWNARSAIRALYSLDSGPLHFGFRLVSPLPEPEPGEGAR